MRLTGQAEADKITAIGMADAKAAEALGLARAAGFEAQRHAIGELPTALVAMTNAVAEGHIDVMPDVLVTGGGSSHDGLAASLIRMVQNGRDNGRGPGEVAGSGGSESEVEAIRAVDRPGEVGSNEAEGRERGDRAATEEPTS